MGIGDLKYRITLQRQVLSVNENGFETEGYEDYRSVWASVSRLYGREDSQAATVLKERNIIFLIRSITGIDETMRIAFEGKHYNIISIDKFKHNNRYFEVKALEVEHSG